MQKVKTDLDMCGNQLINPVVENKLMTDEPTKPPKGTIRFDTSNNELVYFNGTEWLGVNPYSMLQFAAGDPGILKVYRQKVVGGGIFPESIPIIDTSDFESAGTAAQALSSAKSYTDTKVSQLLGGAPSAALDTIFELAQAVQNNQELISTLQQLVTTGVHKSRVSCPALTAQNGVCTWVCDHGLTLNSWKNDSTVICDVYEAATSEKVLCDVKINSASNVIIKFAGTGNISAGTYYAVFVG